MTRRILITLGATTDDERCGDCPHGSEVSPACFEFDIWRDDQINTSPSVWLRLPECIEAEKEAAKNMPAKCSACDGSGRTWSGEDEDRPVACWKCKESRRG